jgi:ABC-type transport system substrate-binding protein
LVIDLLPGSYLPYKGICNETVCYGEVSLLFVLLLSLPVSGVVFAQDMSVFRISQGVDLATWDPHLEQNVSQMTYYSLPFDGLIGENSDGSTRPGLATEWEQTTEYLDLTLRERCTFPLMEPPSTPKRW